MEEKKEIEIRSDEVQEILSYVPHWMIRRGITLLFSLLLLLIFISWFIKYPDVVSGQIILTTEQPPSRLVSQTNGYVEDLMISNDSSITKGQVIAEIKSPIRKSSMDSLRSILHQKNDHEIIERLQRLSDLGVLQNEVNTLVNDLIESQDLSTNNYLENSINNLTNQIESNTSLARITKQELSLLKVEISNAKEKYEADSLLYHQAVIAKHTFYANQSEYFAKKQQFINTKKAAVQHRITASNYEKQKIDLLKSFEDQERILETRINASKKSIESSIMNWQQNFVLTAPMDGKLTYLSNLSKGKYVTTQQPLFAIIPEGESVIGIVSIVNQAFGKIQLHQKVRMKFDNYPYQEFGQLIGSVTEISRIPSEQGYFITVKLEKGLETTYNKAIQYKPEMTGAAEIITEDLRLIERIFNNFRKVLDQ